MIPVDMEFLREEGHVGDCARACTASLLGVPREQVPHFVKDHGGQWQFEWEDWLEARGYVAIMVDPRLRPDCEYLAAGPTVRQTEQTRRITHMVVMNGADLAHDPHPSRAGLIAVTTVYLIVPTKLSV